MEKVISGDCWQARSIEKSARSRAWFSLDYVWVKETNAWEEYSKLKQSNLTTQLHKRNSKKQRNIVNKAVKQVKQFYYHTSFSDHKGDSQKTWQIINELTSRMSGKSSVRELRVNRQSVTNPVELAEEFNHHFATIGTKLASEISESASTSYHNYLTGTNKRFEFRPTTPHHIFALLNTLDKSNAFGLDDISARLVRECVDLICTPLCVIFNNKTWNISWRLEKCPSYYTF